MSSERQAPTKKRPGVLVHTIVSQYAIVPITLGIGILYARSLEPQMRGVLELALACRALVVVVALLGIDQAITYFVAKYPEKRREVFWSGASLALLTATITIAASSLAILPVVLSEADGLTRHLVEIGVISALFDIGFLAIRLARGCGRAEIANYLMVGIPACNLVAAVAIVLIGSASATTFLYARIGVGVCSLVPSWYVAQLLVGGFAPPRTRMWGSLMRYGVRTMAESATAAANTQLDKIVIAMFLNTEELGLYAVAVTAGSVSVPIGAAMGKVIFPTVAGEQGGRCRDGLVLRSLLGTGGVAVLIAGLGGLAAPVVVPALFSFEYYGAVLATQILLFASVFLVLGFVLRGVLKGMGYPETVFYAQMIGLCFTVAGLFLLVPRYGIVGAAITSFCAYGGTTVFLLEAVRRCRRKMIGPVQPRSANVSETRGPFSLM